MHSIYKRNKQDNNYYSKEQYLKLHLSTSNQTCIVTFALKIAKIVKFMHIYTELL